MILPATIAPLAPPLISTPAKPLPEMTLPKPEPGMLVRPPMELSRPPTIDTPTELPIGSVPVRSVPMKLPATILPESICPPI